MKITTLIRTFVNRYSSFQIPLKMRKRKIQLYNYYYCTFASFDVKKKKTTKTLFEKSVLVNFAF